MSKERKGMIQLVKHREYRWVSTTINTYVPCVKLNDYCTMYCRLIYEPCLHKCICFNCHINRTSFEISLSYQAHYQYLLDNPVSGPSFVPTVIAAHCWICPLWTIISSLFSLIIIFWLISKQVCLPVQIFLTPQFCTLQTEVKTFIRLFHISCWCS